MRPGTDYFLWSYLISAQREIVASSSSRPYGKPRREARRSRRERLNWDYKEKDEEEEWQGQQLANRESNSRVQPYHGTSYPSKPSPQRRSPQHPRRPVSPPLKKRSPRANSRPYHGTPPPPPSRTPPLDELASIDGDSNVDASTESQQEEDEQDEDPAPLPLPRALRRQPSVTMPGALFPRSPSMDPEAPAAVARHVHFPTKPTYFDYEVPVPGPSSPPERPQLPSSIPRGSRSRAASVSETSVRLSQQDGVDVVSSGPSWKGKGRQRANAADVFLESEASSPPRPTGTGRGEDHTSDAGSERTGVDTSGEIRVRGKERELSAAREERRAREQWWESEVETTLIREEKVEYQDKIKRLEEEVQWLKAEVCDFPPRPTLCPIRVFSLRC